jgi:hypothetical protein
MIDFDFILTGLGNGNISGSGSLYIGAGQDSQSGSGAINGIDKLQLLSTQAGDAQITGSGGYGAGIVNNFWVLRPRIIWGGGFQPSRRITPLQAARPSTDVSRGVQG